MYQKPALMSAGKLLPSVKNGEGANWKRCSSSNRGRRREEAEGAAFELVQPAQVLHDRNSSREQDGMCRSRGVGHVVDVCTVNTNHSCTCLHKLLTGGCGEKWTGTEVVGRTPAVCPSRVNQHGLSSDICGRKAIRTSRTIFRAGYKDAGKIHQSFKRQRCEIVTVRMSMKWSVHVGSSIAAQFPGSDLEGRARSIACVPRSLVVG